jgi:hypothetical protein
MQYRPEWRESKFDENAPQVLGGKHSHMNSFSVLEVATVEWLKL